MAAIFSPITGFKPNPTHPLNDNHPPRLGAAPSVIEGASFPQPSQSLPHSHPLRTTLCRNVRKISDFIRIRVPERTSIHSNDEMLNDVDKVHNPCYHEL